MLEESNDFLVCFPAEGEDFNSDFRSADIEQDREVVVPKSCFNSWFWIRDDGPGVESFSEGSAAVNPSLLRSIVVLIAGPADVRLSSSSCDDGLNRNFDAGIICEGVDSLFATEVASLARRASVPCTAVDDDRGLKALINSTGKSATPMVKLVIVPASADAPPDIGSQGPESVSYLRGRYLYSYSSTSNLFGGSYNLRSEKFKRPSLERTVAASALRRV